LWLAEVFGGPSRYTDELGGYPAMMRHHLGLGISEGRRQRWVQLITETADDAGLPSDPEFRSAFVGLKAGPGSGGLAYRPGVLDQRPVEEPKEAPKRLAVSNAALSILTDQAAVERWEAAYDAEAGYPRALKGLSKMLSQVTTLRRENTELVVRVREPEVRTPASSNSPSHPSADGERPSP
jgi:globin